MSFQDLQTKIHEWQTETFGPGSPKAKLEHLKEEVEELEKAIEEDDYVAIPEEVADCGLLLVGIAAQVGFSFTRALQVKLKVNKMRDWGEPDKRGVVHHIDEKDSED